MPETPFQPLSQEDPLEKEMATYSVFLPGESHGQGNLAGYSPQSHKDSDTIEAIQHACSHSKENYKRKLDDLYREASRVALSLQNIIFLKDDIQRDISKYNMIWKESYSRNKVYTISDVLRFIP